MADEEPVDVPPFHERDDTIGVADQFEMVTKFAMEPNLGHYGHEKLSHINKNLLFTNLQRRYDEPGEVVRMLKNITILKRFATTSTRRVPTGQYEKTAEDAESVTAREIYVETPATKYRWDHLIDYFATKAYGVTTTAAGTDAALLERLKSTFLHKEQTIEDRTETKRGFWTSMKKGR